MFEEPAEALDSLVRRVIGAAMSVHRALGPGFSESVYEEALCIELSALRIAHARQVVIELAYRGQRVGQQRLDVLVEGVLVLELKSVEAISKLHKAQLNSYLNATGHKLGLLINFDVPLLRDGVHRVIRKSTS